MVVVHHESRTQSDVGFLSSSSSGVNEPFWNTATQLSALYFLDGWTSASPHATWLFHRSQHFHNSVLCIWWVSSKRNLHHSPPGRFVNFSITFWLMINSWKFNLIRTSHFLPTNCCSNICHFLCKWLKHWSKILPSHGKPSARRLRPWCLHWWDSLSRPCCTPSRRSWSSPWPPEPGRRGFFEGYCASVIYWY